MKQKIFLIIIFSLFAGFGVSQNIEGVHKIRNFLPEEYNGHPQAFSVVQDKIGIIYIGTVGNGIFQYDGVSWTNIVDTTYSAIFSMDIAKDGTIFCGRNNDIAYLQNQKNGSIKIKSLNYLLEDTSFTFQSVWTTKVHKNKVYFVCYDAVFEYEIGTKNKIKIYKPEKNYLLGLFISGNRVFVREHERGLLEVKNDKMELVPNGEFIKDYKYSASLPFSDEKSLITSRLDGSYLFNTKQNTFTPFIFPDNSFFDYNQTYKSAKTKNDFMFFGSLAKGVLVTNLKGEKIAELNDKTNLKSNYILSLFPDNQNNMWLGSSNGVSFVDYDFDLTYWNSDNGFSGTVQSIIKFENRIYIATESTVYFIENDKINEISGITKGQFWDFLIFEQNKTKKLLVSGSDGIYEIIYNTANQIFKGDQAFVLYQSKKVPNRLFSTNGYSNFVSFVYENGKFEFEKNWDIGGDEVRRITEHNEEIWLMTFRSGLAKLKLSDDYAKIDSLKFYTTDNGLPELNCEIYNYQNKLLAASQVGFFYYNQQTDSFEVFNDFGKFFNEKSHQVYYFKQNDDKILIAPSNNKTSPIGILTKQKNGSFCWLSKPFEKIPNMIIYSTLIDSTDFWIGGTEGLFRYNSKRDNKNYEQKFNSIIRKVTIGEDSIIYFGNSKTIDIKHYSPVNFDYNSFRFDYATAFFQNAEENIYSYKLENFDDHWSPWTSATYKEFSYLSEGEYTFLVKAKNIYGNESEIASFSFKILPPWYKTIYAYFAYFLLIILFLFGIIKLFTRRLVKQKERLEKIVKERTSEISQQKEEIQAQAEELEVMNSELYKINKELEKLSIVASETDNAIVIMDSEGNFEWINDGFTNLYGYNFRELTEKYKNIKEISSHKKIKNLILDCIKNGTPKIYESVTVAKNGEEIWVQTTLTPISDEMGDIYKIIAIDSDIRKLKKVENELKLKNEHITDSIRYAKTIQTAILPFDEQIGNSFDNFILFRPKDIVSGDFYWYVSVHSEKLKVESEELKIQNSKLNTENSKLITYNFLAAVDCTGHGVPGAFMSMIGSSLLNQIIYNDKEYNTANILTKLHKLVIKSLRQDKTDNNDGMDVCLTRIEKTDEGANVQFTGAKRPLLYISAGGEKVEQLKGDRKSIGGTQKKRKVIEFTTQNITFAKGTQMYLTSDGYIDQNNADRRKFGTRQLVEVLESVAKQNMQTQHDVLNSKIENWIQGTDQRDDITVIGINI